MIRYSKQTISNSDIKEVVKVINLIFLHKDIKSLSLKTGKKYTSAKYSVAINSASSGLFLACKST